MSNHVVTSMTLPVTVDMAQEQKALNTALANWTPSLTMNTHSRI